MKKGLVLNTLIRDGNNELAKQLVKEGYPINKTKESNRLVSLLTQNERNENTPLYTACECNNREMIKYLLDNNANPNLRTYGREYPFEMFLMHCYEDEELFALFLAKGADIEKYMIKPPVAALMGHYHTADERHREIMQRELRELIKCGIKWRNDDMESQYGGYSLLHYVASTDRLDFMQELLYYNESRSCINTKTNTGYTPYALAKKNGEQQMCELLEKAGADINL